MKHCYRFVKVFAVATVAQCIANPLAFAAWNSVTGVKDDNDAAVENVDPWIGPQLVAYGGTLDFAGDVQTSGQLFFQEQNSWGDPIVTVAGTLAMDAPAAQFTVLDGAQLIVNDTTSGFVNSGTAQINGGSRVAIADLTVTNAMATSGSVTVDNTGSSLNVAGNFGQTGRDFQIRGGANFAVDGSFTVNDTGEFIVLEGSTFSIGDLTSGSATVGSLLVNQGSSVTLPTLDVTSGSSSIFDANSSLHVLGNFGQTGRDFQIRGGANFAVDGSFTVNDTGEFIVLDGSTFSIGDLTSGSVTVGSLLVNGGSTVTIPNLTTGGNVDVRGDGSSLRVIGDFVNVAGSVSLAKSSTFQVTPGAQMNVGGDFLFQQDDQTQLELDQDILHLNGTGTQSLEAGGVDGGVGGSTSSNFGIGRLEIGEAGAPTTVHMADRFDNGNRGPAAEAEALYLYGLGGSDGLLINDGSALVLNGINVYASMDGQMTHLNDLLVGGVVGIPLGAGFVALYEPETGDLDLDGDIDFDDIAAMVLALNSSETYEGAFGLPARLAGDVDGDGDVDFDDIDGFVHLLTAGPAASQAVPEPSAVALLLVGLAGCLIRSPTVWQ